jgi:hypothetical protein
MEEQQQQQPLLEVCPSPPFSFAACFGGIAL